MMEQRKKNPWSWYKNLRMSGKIMLSVGLIIFCSNLLILVLVCKNAETAIHRQTETRTQSQLTVSLSAVNNTIKDISELMVMLSTNTNMEAYASNSYPVNTTYSSVLQNTNENIRILKNTHDMIDYVALLRVDNKRHLYVGEELYTREIYNYFFKSLMDGWDMNYYGMKMSLMTEGFKTSKLNLFCPVYKPFSLTREPTAYLVVGMNIGKMYNAFAVQDENLNIRILNKDGLIILSADSEEIGSTTTEKDDYIDMTGTIDYKEDYLFWQYLSGGLWLADGRVSKSPLFSEIYSHQWFLGLIILLFTIIAIIITRYICLKAYEPMEEMMSTMGEIGNGNLEVHMNDYEQEDFNKIATSFNQMSDSIHTQIETIKQKEQDNTRIRLNSLQSQIKPHFLYNTLECIHWQALMEDAPDTSDMVMALSRFYRLSLSKGAEIIALSQEISHVESFIRIQNIRFDDIVEVSYDIEEDTKNLEIPKITLQPLVENAIYHGIKVKGGPKGHVLISSHKDGDWLVIKVKDDGIGMTEEALEELNRNIGVLVDDGSYGVKNVHKRLEIRYGEGSGLFYETNETGGITVTVTLPARILEH